MATKERLIGADGLVEVGSMAVASGTAASGVWTYVVASGTGTGSAGASGMSNGDFFRPVVTMSGTSASYQAVTFSNTPLFDIQSWSCEFSADEIEVTVLSDSVKKYRRGKVDASGSLKGVMILGTTTLSGTASTAGILPRFLKANYTTVSSTAFNATVSNALYFRGIMQKDRTSGEKYAFIFGQIELYNLSTGGDVGGAQEFDSKFRFIGFDPIYCEETV